MMEKLNLLILVIAAVTALLIVVIKKVWLKRQTVDEPKLIEISGFIRKGVLSFIKRQYTSAGIIIAVIFVALLFMAYFGFISFYTPFAVLSGAFFSALSAYLGMTAAVQSNAIVAHYTKKGINPAFRVGLNSGAVMGFLFVALGF